MDTLLPILSRWIHVGTAVVLVGGVVFKRYVLIPAAASLPDEAHNSLRERVMGTWRKYVMIGIVLLLVSGLYNYYVVITTTTRAEQSKLYHPLMGVKIILALVIFFLASALVGRSPALEGIRQKGRMWMSVSIVLAALVIAIAGYLKVAV